MSSREGQITCIEWNPSISYFQKIPNNNVNKVIYDHSSDNNIICCDTLAYGTSTGAINLINFKNLIHPLSDYVENSKVVDTEIAICNPIKFGKRNCNALSWNKVNTSQLAGGFENTKRLFIPIIVFI